MCSREFHLTKFDEKAEPFLFEGTENHALLLVHGFTGSPAHVRLMGEYLHKNTGCTVCGIRLSGHGTSARQLRRYSWQDWVADVRLAFESLRVEYGRVSIVGFSLGGLLGLKSAGELPVYRLVSIAAGVRLWHPPSRFLPVLRYLPLKMKWHGYTAGRSKKSRRYRLDYHQGYPEFYYKNAASGIRFCRLVEESLSEVQCPLLVVQPQWDEQVDLESADIIFNGVSSEQKELMSLESSLHLCVIGPERKELFRKVAEFVTG